MSKPLDFTGPLENIVERALAVFFAALLVLALLFMYHELHL